MKTTHQEDRPDPKDVTRQIVYLLSDRFVNRFSKLYARTKEDNKVHKYILKEFQENVKNHAQNVPICFAEDTSPAFEDLVIRMLARSSQSSTSSTSSPNKVYASCFIEVARALWKQPQLFYHGVPIADYQANMHACEKLIRRCIKDALAMQTWNNALDKEEDELVEQVTEAEEEDEIGIEDEAIELVTVSKEENIVEKISDEVEVGNKETTDSVDQKEEVVEEISDEVEVGNKETTDSVDQKEEVVEEISDEVEVGKETTDSVDQKEEVVEEISDEVEVGKGNETTDSVDQKEEVVEEISDEVVNEVAYEVTEEDENEEDEDEEDIISACVSKQNEQNEQSKQPIVEVVKENSVSPIENVRPPLSLRPKPINDAWDTKSIDIERDAEILRKYVHVSDEEDEDNNSNPTAGTDNSNEFF